MKYLDNCQNMFGPLSPDIKARLRKLIVNPSVENWEDAHGIIVQTNPLLTLWQAWVATDPEAPRRGRAFDENHNVVSEWEKIPTSFAIMRALEYATTGN